MSTDSHSTASEDGTAAVQPGQSKQNGGRVLARIPDVRPALEEAGPTQEMPAHRVDAAHSQPGSTVALLRRNHSGLHISRRFVAVVGSVVALLVVAVVFIRMRNDMAGSEDQAGLPHPMPSLGATPDQHANGPWSGLSNSTGQDDPWRGRDHGKHQGITSPAPDDFVRGIDLETGSPWPSEPIGGPAAAQSVYSNSTPARVVARLESDDRGVSPGHDERPSIFPWRNSGQQLPWQRSGEPSVQIPVERSQAARGPTPSRGDDRFSGAARPDRWNTGGPTRQYPETGVRGAQVYPSGTAAPRTGERYDDRSARGGTTLADEARRSTYDEGRRAGASFDGRIEPPNYRVHR